MDQLQLLLLERRMDQTLLPANSRQDSHKSTFLEREKQRIQKENWILKVFKTIRISTTDSKKLVHETLFRMMSHYRQLTQPDVDYDTQFTEALINLFFQFYSLDEEGLASLRAIIRPNNQFITQDLLKNFVQFTRIRFRKNISIHFNELQQARKPNLIPSLTPPTKTELPKKSFQTPQHLEPDFISAQITQSLHGKYNNFLDSFDYKMVETKSNDNYFQLLRLNGNNGQMIEKFYQKCFGKKKNINYNYDKLYTKQQLEKNNRKLFEEFDHIKKLVEKQLIGEVNEHQLKQHFRLKIQTAEIGDKVRAQQRQIARKVNDWLSLNLNRSGPKNWPLVLNAIKEEEVPVAIFYQIFGVPLKSYLREQLARYQNQGKAEKHGDSSLKKHGDSSLKEHRSCHSLFTKNSRDLHSYEKNSYYNSEHKYPTRTGFKKQLFLDSYGQKVKELLCKKPLYYIKQKVNKDGDQDKSECKLPALKHKNKGKHARSQTHLPPESQINRKDSLFRRNISLVKAAYLLNDPQTFKAQRFIRHTRK